MADSNSRENEARKDLAKSYNSFKDFEGKKYTGMKIGRAHKWHYDRGEWKEKKITPDFWEFNYPVTKRRAGKAPEGSGVPVGTEYHWYILAHQNVRKLDANTYTTSMSGLKYKLAHKRAGSQKWSYTEKTQRKRLIELLKDMLAQLENEEYLESAESKPARKNREKATEEEKPAGETGPAEKKAARQNKGK
ncbi:MAG: hypothetical protein ACLFVE_06205 [Chitinispirillaceae bacterium]